jgi:ABC-type uncharacterized transport system YnjBCD ATPase subunit
VLFAPPSSKATPPFGLVGDIAFQDAGTLSGGEKTKLPLAQLVAGRHNLLFLDEPTAPDRALLLPEGTLDYWSNDLLDLVALA